MEKILEKTISIDNRVDEVKQAMKDTMPLCLKDF